MIPSIKKKIVLVFSVLEEIGSYNDFQTSLPSVTLTDVAALVS